MRRYFSSRCAAPWLAAHLGTLAVTVGLLLALDPPGAACHYVDAHLAQALGGSSPPYPNGYRLIPNYGVCQYGVCNSYYPSSEACQDLGLEPGSYVYGPNYTASTLPVGCNPLYYWANHINCPSSIPPTSTVGNCSSSRTKWTDP